MHFDLYKMWKSAQHPLVGSGVKKLMYSHETEQPYLHNLPP